MFHLFIDCFSSIFFFLASSEWCTAAVTARPVYYVNVELGNARIHEKTGWGVVRTDRSRQKKNYFYAIYALAYSL